MGNQYCEYFIKHTQDGYIGDDKVFLYFGALACDNYDCPHENHSGEKFLHEGDGSKFGFCLSNGEIKKSELVAEVESSN